MANQTTFGRRNMPQRPAPHGTAKPDPVAPGIRPAPSDVLVDHPLVPHGGLVLHGVDNDLRDWKQARKQHSKLPWRQLSLMASLCFGIASFVLPDSVNQNLDWVLYGLMAASLYAGLRRRSRA